MLIKQDSVGLKEEFINQEFLPPGVQTPLAKFQPEAVLLASFNTPPPKRDALDGSAGVPLLLGAPTKRRAEEGKRNAGRLRETHAPKNQPSPALPCRSPGPVVSPCLLLTSLFRHSSRKNVYFYAVHAGAVPPLQSPGLQSFLAKKTCGQRFLAAGRAAGIACLPSWGAGV